MPERGHSGSTVNATRASSVRPGRVLRYNQYDQIIHAAAAGQGIALGRLNLLREFVADGRLVVLQVPGASPSNDHGYWLFSAEASPGEEGSGVFRFRMPQAIPSYLIALAVGDLTFKAMSDRTGVWAEPAMIDAAAREFEDTEKMIKATEALYGPYRWGRYDLLVLPPSFPFGNRGRPPIARAVARRCGLHTLALRRFEHARSVRRRRFHWWD